MSLIKDLHHAQVTIPPGAEDEARRFYCEVLGLEEVDKPEALRSRGGLWLAVGARQVHLGIEEGHWRAESRAHLAYEVRDIDEARALLLAHGVSIEESAPIAGRDRFECRDPFGNRIELIAPHNRRGG